MFLANKLNKGAGVPTPKDAQFNYVTMLLHGDGTNGAQNNTFLDSSTNNFTITRNGNTTQGSFSPYGSNWSNYFDGSGDYLSVPDNSALEGFTNFTFECWLYVSDFASGDIVFAKGFGPGFCPYMFYFTSTDLVFYASSSLSSWDVADSQVIVSNIVKNQWYHVAASRSGSSIKLFANGAVTTSLTNGSTLGTNATTFNVASAVDGTRNPEIYISNLRINNTALYTAAFTPSTTPLTAVSGTALLTCQSNRFIDNSTNNFTISSFGTASVQRFNPFGASTAYSTSVIGGSGYFDGTGDYLSVPDDVQFNLTTSDYTMEMWVYPTTFASLNVPFAYGWTSGSGTRLIVFIQNTNGTYQIYYNDASNTFTTTNTVKLNAWNHLALVRNGSNFDFYINGVSSASATNSFSYPDSSFPIVIGSSWSGSTGAFFYTGYISDVRICVGAAVYTSGFTPPTAPLTTANTPALLCKFTNGAIFDNAMMNDLETLDNSQISTSVKKYGTGSIAFDGSGDWMLSVASQNIGFRTGDFTVEFWIYPSNWTNTYVGVMAGIVTNSVWIGKNASNFVLRAANNTDLISYGTMPTTGTWTHIAITRSGTTARMFYDGTQVASATTAHDFVDAAFYIGQDGGSNAFTGYIDDLRITKGYARYTANFTAPTAALPDIGPI
jgi:hypothetical protein